MSPESSLERIVLEVLARKVEVAFIVDVLIGLRLILVAVVDRAGVVVEAWRTIVVAWLTVFIIFRQWKLRSSEATSRGVRTGVRVRVFLREAGSHGLRRRGPLASDSAS